MELALVGLRGPVGPCGLRGLVGLGTLVGLEGLVELGGLVGSRLTVLGALAGTEGPAGDELGHPRHCPPAPLPQGQEHPSADL